MRRYIDADALYKVVTEKYYDITAGCYPYNIVAYDMARLVKNAPTADVVEVRHGYNKDFDYPSLFECSICGASDGDTYTGEGEYKYCPWCGAKMDGERRER